MPTGSGTKATASWIPAPSPLCQAQGAKSTPSKVLQLSNLHVRNFLGQSILWYPTFNLIYIHPSISGSLSTAPLLSQIGICPSVQKFSVKEAESPSALFNLAVNKEP